MRASVPRDPETKHSYTCSICGTSTLVLKVYTIDSMFPEFKFDKDIDLLILIGEYSRFRKSCNSIGWGEDIVEE